MRLSPAGSGAQHEGRNAPARGRRAPSFQPVIAMYTLVFLEPGHFHAALTLRTQNPRVDPTVHLYARAGAERDAFLDLVASFNRRADQPTAWTVKLHEPADPERALVEERPGGIVILAGRTRPKLGTIARLHAAGLHVLADKPWLTESGALDHLGQATAGWPLAIDIMTFRHEVVARLAHEIATDPDLFGTLEGSADEPAIDIQSVHHLLKLVNGAPLRRPAWYYDTRIQGDGLVDIQSHMADQAQWIIGDGDGLVFDRDYVIEGARRWTTPVPAELFRASTGLDAFPPDLLRRIGNGVLQLACNGEIRYRLRGVPVRQRAEWGQREPDGGGDAHRTTIRGSEATLIARRGPETGFQGELHLSARTPGPGFTRRLTDWLASREAGMPGLSQRPSEPGCEIVIPHRFHTPHEAHFAMVLDEFLDLLEAGEWPRMHAARIRARYTLLARAREHCTDDGTGR